MSLVAALRSAPYACEEAWGSTGAGDPYEVLCFAGSGGRRSETVAVLVCGGSPCASSVAAGLRRLGGMVIAR